jgi:cholesterol oxidase
MTAPDTVRRAQAMWSGLAVPSIADLQGTWRPVFLRPLRHAAPVGLAVIGLPRWEGKRFDGSVGTNLVRRRAGAVEERLPMTLGIGESWADGRPAAVVSYASEAPRPWRWVRDEIRLLGPGSAVGLTFTDVPGGRRHGLPFLLQRAAG